MEPMEIETGIYRNFKGGLYFVRETVINKENDTLSILYNALYPGPTKSYCRSLDNFKGTIFDKSFNPVPRFVLVLGLPAHKWDVLRPGAAVICNNVRFADFAVSSLCEENGRIAVQLAFKVQAEMTKLMGMHNMMYSIILEYFQKKYGHDVIRHEGSEMVLVLKIESFLEEFHSAE